jgi:putative endonuclease
MYFVYAIKSVEQSYIYVGLTDNLDRRLNQHNKGYNKSTKPYRPFFCFYVEEYSTRPEARKREIFLKKASGKRFLKFRLKEFIKNQ